MICIYCNKDTGVYNSRQRARSMSVWRRRRCKACVAQFSTTETPDYELALAVEGLSGKLYSFSRDKLFLSIHNALGHRKDAIGSATEITETAISKLLRDKLHSDGVIQSTDLAYTTHQALRRYDSLAANTYKAYHKTALKRHSN